MRLIPSEILVRAEKGGWDCPEILEYIFYTLGGLVGKEKADEYIERIIISFPDFWSALGKVRYEKDEKKDQMHHRLIQWQTWGINQGEEFCRLILRKASQEKIDEFWKSIV